MGLDMYLNAKLYTSKYIEEDINTKINSLGVEYPCATEDRGSVELVFQAMYWRKANAIHNWFVQNVQDGVDECQHVYVGRDKLAELRDLCLEAVAKRDADLLPPTSGFFFGSTEIDEYYWGDITETADALDKILAHPKFDDFSFEYHSSW